MKLNWEDPKNQWNLIINPSWKDKLYRKNRVKDTTIRNSLKKTTKLSWDIKIIVNPLICKEKHNKIDIRKSWYNFWRNKFKRRIKLPRKISIWGKSKYNLIVIYLKTHKWFLFHLLGLILPGKNSWRWFLDLSSFLQRTRKKITLQKEEKLYYIDLIICLFQNYIISTLTSVKILELPSSSFLSLSSLE